jgi:hypothetical protein
LFRLLDQRLIGGNHKSCIQRNSNEGDLLETGCGGGQQFAQDDLRAYQFVVNIHHFDEVGSRRRCGVLRSELWLPRPSR